MEIRNPAQIAVHRQEEGGEEPPVDIRPVFRPKLRIAWQTYNGHEIAKSFWGEPHVNSDDRPQDFLEDGIQCIEKLGNVTFCKNLEHDPHSDILGDVITLLESSDYVKPETFFKVKILELSAEGWRLDLLETHPRAEIDSTMEGAARAVHVRSLEEIRQLCEQVYNSRQRRDTLYLVQIGIYQDPGEQFASQFSLVEMPCWKPAFAFQIMWADHHHHHHHQDHTDVYLLQINTDMNGVKHVSMIEWPDSIKTEKEFPAYALSPVRQRPPSENINKIIKSNLRLCTTALMKRMHNIQSMWTPFTPVETTPTHLLLQRVDTDSPYAGYAPAGRRVLQNPGDEGNCLFDALSHLYCKDNGFTHQFRLGACLFGARNFKRIYEYIYEHAHAGNLSEERVKFELAGLRRASEGCNSAEPLPPPCLFLDEIFQTSIDRNPAGLPQLILAASYLARPIHVFSFEYGCEDYYEKTLVMPVHTPLGVLEPLELSSVTGASPVGHYVPLVCAKP